MLLTLQVFASKWLTLFKSRVLAVVLGCMLHHSFRHGDRFDKIFDFAMYEPPVVQSEGGFTYSFNQIKSKDCVKTSCRAAGLHPSHECTTTQAVWKCGHYTAADYYDRLIYRCFYFLNCICFLFEKKIDLVCS